MRHIDDTERRSRLARRHGIHPAHRLDGPAEITRAMTVLHATEAASVHLAVHARSDGVTPQDVDTALYTDRTLVKQLAMRRTLFALPRDLMPAALGSASARVAGAHHRSLVKQVERSGIATDGSRWLAQAASAAIDHLAGSEPLSATQMREQVPQLSGAIPLRQPKRAAATVENAGKSAAKQPTFPAAREVLTLLGAEGRLTRGPNAAHWRTGRPTWTLMTSWLGGQPDPLPAADGYAEIVRRWLFTFGPGTTEDLPWWLGSTKTAARAALEAVGAVQVSLDGGQVGWVLPGDLDPVPAPEPWAALLPTLDPTTMGWRGRNFYLQATDVPYLFDTNGNAGTTAWWNGRIVGCWVQDDDGEVQVILRDPSGVGSLGRSALQTEARRLSAWLDGVHITNMYASHAMKQARLP